jgi:hypothetical protein
MIVVGWFGVGKTTFIETHPEADAVDLNSFTGRTSDIVEKCSGHRYLLADPNLVPALKPPYVVVVPAISRKQEFLEIYRHRKGRCGHGPEFARLRDLDWEKRITELMNIPGTRTIILEEGQFLSDVIDKL